MGETGTHRRLAALMVVAAVSGVVASYAGKAEAGKTVAPPRALVAEPARPQSLPPIQSCPLPRDLRPAFERASLDTALPLSMLVAVGKVESNLRMDATSQAGARGLLQLMPSTAAALQLNVDDPGSNVLAGARYLRQMLDRFNSTDLALAAYNAGPTAVEHAGGVPSRGVESYVLTVTDIWRSLAGCS